MLNFAKTFRNPLVWVPKDDLEKTTTPVVATIINETLPPPKPPTPVLKFPTGEVIPIESLALSQEKIKSYEEIAEELGFVSTDLFLIQMRHYFAEEKMPLFDIEEVNKWMNKKSLEAGKGWIWRPLRQQDVLKHPFWTDKMNWEHFGNGYRQIGDYRVENSTVFKRCTVYNKAVPEKALRDAHKISQKFGDRVAFFVSDYSDIQYPKPDPFIMVIPKMPVEGPFQKACFVFGFWDEPGFGE